jgi:hypothetical protein
MSLKAMDVITQDAGVDVIYATLNANGIIFYSIEKTL